MHSKKAIFFDKDSPLTKDIVKLFDVTMGSYDGMEICELVILYTSSTPYPGNLTKKNWTLPKGQTCSYQNHIRSHSQPYTEDITKTFPDIPLRITINFFSFFLSFCLSFLLYLFIICFLIILFKMIYFCFIKLM